MVNNEGSWSWLNFMVFSDGQMMLIAAAHNPAFQRWWVAMVIMKGMMVMTSADSW